MKKGKFRKINNLLLAVSVVVFLVMAVSACYYDDDAFIIPDIPDSGEISFATNIQPIFNQSCNNAGCHDAQGPSPDLSAGVAYSNLIADNLVDVDNPAASVLIVRMRSTSSPMPTSGNLPQAQINVVEEWIRQGALDN